MENFYFVKGGRRENAEMSTFPYGNGIGSKFLHMVTDWCITLQVNIKKNVIYWKYRALGLS